MCIFIEKGAVLQFLICNIFSLCISALSFEFMCPWSVGELKEIKEAEGQASAKKCKET